MTYQVENYTVEQLREIAKERDLDFGQLETAIAMAPDRAVQSGSDISWAIDSIGRRLNNGGWFQKPRPGVQSFWIDRNGFMWVIPFAGHSSLAAMLNVASTDTLEACGWIHASNDLRGGTPYAEVFGKPTRSQEQTLEKTLKGVIRLQENEAYSWHKAVAEEHGALVVRAERVRRRIERELREAAKEAA